MKISRRQFWLWSAIVAGLAIVGGSVGYWEVEGVEQGEHVAHVDWLPAEARDICYYRSRTFTAAEFRIGEADFLKWCKTRGFALLPIGDEPFKISRYRAPTLQAELSAASKGLSDDQRMGSAKFFNDAGTRVIVHGLGFKQLNGGGIVSAAYDRDVGVGFYVSTHP